MSFFVRTLRALLALVLVLALSSGAWVEYAARNACAHTAARVGPTWRREDSLQTLVDRVVPQYELGERHRLFVRAPAARVLAAALELTDAEQPLAALFGVLRRAPPEDARLLESLRKTATVVLHAPNREWVFATVAERQPHLKLNSARAFRAYRLRPGEAKVAVSVRADPAPHGSWLSTETRLFFADPQACRDFARYWGVIYPGSALTRLDILAAIRRRAEGETAQRAAPSSPLHFSAIAVFARANHQLLRGPL